MEAVPKPLVSVGSVNSAEPNMNEVTVRLPSGRALLVLEEGDLQGHPVFALHGTPGSRLLYPPLIQDAASKGIRLISYDRPGYGGSTPHPGRNVADAARDVEAIADHLGLDRFGVWGHSGGGAPSLACAAVLGRRVVGAAALSGVAPHPAEGLDWLAGMGEFNVSDFELMLRDRTAWEEKCRKDREELLGWDIDHLRVGFSTLLSEVDRHAFTDELAGFFLQQSAEALKRSELGMRDDSLSEIRPWGFELRQIRVPVQVWHGGQDRFVPYSHGEWLSAHVPRAEAHLEPDQGHLTMLVERVPLVHSWLVSKF